MMTEKPIKLSSEAKAAFEYIESNLGTYCRERGHSFPYVAPVMVCEYCSLVVEIPELKADNH